MGISEQDVTIELLDGQGREDEILLVLPIMGADGEGNDLPIQVSAVAVSNVQVNRIVGVT
jgi:hypothetical protein